MAAREFSYFYAPSWDFPPDGPIKLGSVITSLKQPQRPLCCFPPSEGNTGDSVFKMEKKSVQYTKEKMRGGKFSILTKFLSVLGLGVDVGAEMSRSEEEIFTFDTLETTQFIPTAAYLQTCIQDDKVRDFLELSRFRKPIFVITGVKVVTGAEANTLKSRDVAGTLAAEVDGTVWSGGAVPISGGPGIEGSVGSKTGTSWGGSSDFVFAFRVSKVKVGKATGKVSEEEYNKGAMLGNEPGEVSESVPLTVVEAEGLDATSEGFKTEDLIEDEETIACAFVYK